MRFGEIFKEQREQLGYTFEAVEEETKIRKMYLDAIEKEKFSVLPPRIYATGFVKRYARFLKLNEKDMVEEFEKLAYAGQVEENPEEVPARPSRKFGFKWKNIMAGVIFLFIAIWVGSFVVGIIVERGQNINGVLPGQHTEQPSLPPENNALPDIDSNDEQPEKGEKEMLARVRVEARQDCWVQAIVDDEQVFQAILPAGEKKLFEGKKKVYLKVGNAGGIDIFYNGEKIEPLGDYYEVKEKEFILQKDNSTQ